MTRSSSLIWSTTPISFRGNCFRSRRAQILKVAPVDDAGNLLMSEFEDLLGPRTKLVAATQVSNALGTVTPVEKIVELGHRYGARVLIDGAQSIPHLPINVSELGADFFVFSGHKIYGPTGIGVLYGTEEALAETPPWQGGGNMIADVTLERSLYQGPPSKFEAGTGNIADAVGLGEALRYVERVGIERIAAYEHALLEYATPRLADIPGVRLVGTAEEKASVLSFVLAGHEPLEVGKALNAEGIAVRAGHHCAQPILRRIRAGGARFGRRSRSTTRSRRSTSSSTRCAGSRRAARTSASASGTPTGCFLSVPAVPRLSPDRPPKCRCRRAVGKCSLASHLVLLTTSCTSPASLPTARGAAKRCAPRRPPRCRLRRLRLEQLRRRRSRDGASQSAAAFLRLSSFSTACPCMASTR